METLGTGGGVELDDGNIGDRRVSRVRWWKHWGQEGE